MTVLTEGSHAAEFVVSPFNPDQNNKTITVQVGQNLMPGHVLGRVSKGIGGAPIPIVAGTGNGIISSLLIKSGALKGSYVLTCITVVPDGGVFSIIGPDGLALPNFTLTPAAGGTSNYISDHFDLSIVDGAIDFAVDDTFTILVSNTAPLVVGTGDGIIGALTLGPNAKHGTYSFTCTTAIADGGVFDLVDPFGLNLGSFTLNAGAGNTTTITTTSISADITDGATDFVVNDLFEAVVFGEVNGGEAVEWDPLTFDGRNIASGLLWDAADATLAAVQQVAVVHGPLVYSKLDVVYGANISASQKIDAEQQLEKLNIIGVTGVQG